MGNPFDVTETDFPLRFVQVGKECVGFVKRVRVEGKLSSNTWVALALQYSDSLFSGLGCCVLLVDPAAGLLAGLDNRYLPIKVSQGANTLDC